MPQIPGSLWERPDMLAALRARDIGQAFRLLRQYAGLSQTTIGSLTGMSQGKVSEIMNGRQQVTMFEVIERIADGLEMPDTVRMALGLAPRTAPLAPIPPRDVGQGFTPPSVDLVQATGEGEAMPQSGRDQRPRMSVTIPNIQLRAWRNERQLTRADMARWINETPVGRIERLSVTEEHVRAWEAGEITWPTSPFRLALTQATGRTPEQLGFTPDRQPRSILVEGVVLPDDALRAEADLYGTMELAQQLQASDLGTGTLEALAEAVDLLCRAYPVVPAATLRDRTRKRLAQITRLLSGRLTLDQHRELLVITGWLTALLGCVHYDLGEREEAETARRAAYEMGRQVGHGELMGWAYEMSAWFALVEGRYEDVVKSARMGQAAAGTSSAMVQLTLQEARGLARIGDRREADRALTRGADALALLPIPEHPDHHFVFDHAKWMFYAATAYTWLEDNDRAEEHALETIQMHTRPDGTSNAPMRVADAHLDLGIVHARRGDLDAAVSQGMAAFDIDRRSLTDLVHRAGDLDRLLLQRYRREALAQEFHERYVTARFALGTRRPELLD
ncbi:hypothetical protein Aple_065810 [Acrocarpospora pleiomorpha]|uniref:HTH cro/C1-type domain-containing protein n=1 Tax=Acrocarpospora pleiomorpha TaxID=90975 RepID=A0A5M3XRK0_9ACTN|nr:helix-turn-helix transcriptional regulator [Acrocarpospora pleiomorpha]GES23682.1 hypothetical protein Aple_065810 [Acrocarpospora pleiomorpha]